MNLLLQITKQIVMVALFIYVDLPNHYLLWKGKQLKGYWIKIIIAKGKSLKITSKKLLELDLPLNLRTPRTLRNRLILKMLAEKFWKLGQRTVSNNTIKLLRNHGSAASVSLNIRRAMWCLVLYSLYQSPNSTYPLDGIIVDVELSRDVKSMFVYATCYYLYLNIVREENYLITLQYMQYNI